jgi:hypothetical protein
MKFFRSLVLFLAVALVVHCLFEGFSEEPDYDGYATDGFGGFRDGYSDAYANDNSKAPTPAKELQSLDDIDAFVQVVSYFVQL